MCGKYVKFILYVSARQFLVFFNRVCSRASEVDDEIWQISIFIFLVLIVEMNKTLAKVDCFRDLRK